MQNNFTEMFLMKTSIKFAKKNGFASPDIKASRSLDKNYV